MGNQVLGDDSPLKQGFCQPLSGLNTLQSFYFVLFRFGSNVGFFVHVRYMISIVALSKIESHGTLFS